MAKTNDVTSNETYDFDCDNTAHKSAHSGTDYFSDENGNQTSTLVIAEMEWDSQNRLIRSIHESTNTSYSYTYGADDLRRKYAVHANPTPRITHYGYDGTNVVREWEENLAGVLSVSATYLLGPNGPMYKRPANAADVRWYVYDGLGSVVGEVDVNGTLIAEKKHDVYGLRRGTVGTEKSKHGFVGGLGHYSDDESRLIYMRARYYDPAIGRFISEDPALHGNNWFAYCSNDPINKVDPKGQSPFDSDGPIDLARLMINPGLNAVMGLLTDALKVLESDLSFTKKLAELKAISMGLRMYSGLCNSVGDAEMQLGVKLSRQIPAAGAELAVLQVRIGEIMIGLGAKQKAYGAAALLAANQIDAMMILML